MVWSKESKVGGRREGHAVSAIRRQGSPVRATRTSCPTLFQARPKAKHGRDDPVLLVFSPFVHKKPVCAPESAAPRQNRFGRNEI